MRRWSAPVTRRRRRFASCGTTPRRTRTTRAPYKTCSTQKTKRRNEKLKRSARRREITISGANIVADAYERHGIKPSDWTMNASYEEMRDYALLERLRERGLDA